MFSSTASGNPAFRDFDIFPWKASTTLYDGYFTLGTGTGSVTRIASDYDPAAPTTTALGPVQLLATADNDEAIMAFGNALDAPFHLGKGRDVAFECRLNSENVAADDFCLFMGLAELGAQATVKINDANQDLVNEFDLLGFQHLMTDFDGCQRSVPSWRADGWDKCYQHWPCRAAHVGCQHLREDRFPLGCRAGSPALVRERRRGCWCQASAK